MKPEQAALTSKAPQRSPSCVLHGGRRGRARSGRGWWWPAPGRRSTAGSTPACSMARRPASTDSDAVVPPTRRSRMPVRSLIHASLVSIVLARSSLVTTLSGRAVPQPRDHAAADAPRDRAARQAVLSQAIGWRLVTRSPSTARYACSTPANGERTSWFADAAEDLPRVDGASPRAGVARVAEHAGRRAHDQPLGGEEVLALERRRRRRAGCRPPARGAGRGRRGRPARRPARRRRCAWPCR